MEERPLFDGAASGQTVGQRPKAAVDFFVAAGFAVAGFAAFVGDPEERHGKHQHAERRPPDLARQNEQNAADVQQDGHRIEHGGIRLPQVAADGVDDAVREIGGLLILNQAVVQAADFIEGCKVDLQRPALVRAKQQPCGQRIQQDGQQHQRDDGGNRQHDLRGGSRSTGNGERRVDEFRAGEQQKRRLKPQKDFHQQLHRCGDRHHLENEQRRVPNGVTLGLEVEHDTFSFI